MLIGRLITDEQFRAEFLQDPESTLLGSVRSRPGVEPDGDRGAGEHRSRALGTNGRCHRSAPAEGQPQERSEGPMTTRIAACCLPRAADPGGRDGAAGVRRRRRTPVARGGDSDGRREQPAAAERHGCRSRRRKRTWPWPGHAGCRSSRPRCTASQLLSPVELRLSAGRVRRLPRHRADSVGRYHHQRAAAADLLRVVAGLAADLAAVSHRPRHPQRRGDARHRAGARPRASSSRSSTASSGCTSPSCRRRARWQRTDEAIALYRELDRTLQVRVAQKVALRSDALDVQFRLAQEELSRTTRQNALASQKEQLNQLLGRDVRTAVRGRGRRRRSPSSTSTSRRRTRMRSRTGPTCARRGSRCSRPSSIGG